MIKNLAGKRFFRLLVADRYEIRNHSAYWWCICDCGNEKWIKGESMTTSRKGKTQSCGCWNRDRMLIEKGLASQRGVYNGYKQRARVAKLSLDMDFETLMSITQLPCHYCGTPPNNKKKSRGNNGDFVYGGIDRVDNSKGYTIENCVPCCFVCNKMKGTLTPTDFFNRLEKISCHSQKGGEKC